MISDYLVLGLIGFAAQIVDGCLGMAFGVISTSAMLSFGMAPAQASAIVHTAEIFTTGASASLAHLPSQYRLAAGDPARHCGRARRGGRRVGPLECRCEHHAAVRGGLSHPARHLHPAQGLAALPGRDAPAPWVGPIGFVAGFLDASGGGGWGPVATSSLVGSGHAPRLAVGSVNTTEFFVTIAAATTFFRGARRLAVEGAARADRRRHARGTARRLGREAHPAAPADDRGRLPRDRAVVLADRAGGEVGVSYGVSLLRRRSLRVFELHGDEVGRAHSVAGRDCREGPGPMLVPAGRSPIAGSSRSAGQLVAT